MAEISSSFITDYADILAYCLCFGSDWKHFVDLDKHEKNRLGKVEIMEQKALRLMDELDRLNHDLDSRDHDELERLEREIEDTQRVAIMLSMGWRDMSEVKATIDEQWITLGKLYALEVFKKKRGGGRPRSKSNDFLRAAQIRFGDEAQDNLINALALWLESDVELPRSLTWGYEWTDSDEAGLYFDTPAEIFRVYKVASHNISVENKIKQIRLLLRSHDRPMRKFLLGMEDYCKFQSGSISSIVSAISRGRAKF